MPILQILYHAQDRNSHHIYMALIILLILSEDDLFNKAIHDIVRIFQIVVAKFYFSILSETPLV